MGLLRTASATRSGKRAYHCKVKSRRAAGAARSCSPTQKQRTETEVSTGRLCRTSRPSCTASHRPTPHRREAGQCRAVELTQQCFSAGKFPRLLWRLLVRCSTRRKELPLTVTVTLTLTLTPTRTLTLTVTLGSCHWITVLDRVLVAETGVHAPRASLAAAGRPRAPSPLRTCEWIYSLRIAWLCKTSPLRRHAAEARHATLPAQMARQRKPWGCCFWYPTGSAALT